jgi:hypothetical protein
MATIPIPVSVSDALVFALNQSVSEIAAEMRRVYAYEDVSRGKTHFGAGIGIVSAVNAREGYPAIHIYRPAEVLKL